MKSNDGLRLWLVVIQLLVVLKTGFVSGQCAIASSTIPFTEELPIGFVLTNLTTGPWIFLSSQPPNYIVLDNDSFGYHYLKAAKKIDVEDMKSTLIKVTLNCNDASTGTVVFKAADHVTDEDFTKTLKFSALSQPTGQVPDGVASGMFEVAANGDVKVKGTLDYEKQTEYSIEIEVKELPFSNTTKLTITLQNIDDTGPTFIVSNDSVIGRDAVYLATMSVYHMGEIPITGSPILAEDTDTKQYAVKYTPLTGPMSSYFSIDSSSGKVSVIKKLPEDTKLSIMLFFTAEDVSPKKLASRATLGIILNKEFVPTTTTLGGAVSVVIFFCILTIMGLVLLVVVICLLVLCIRARKLMPIFPFQNSFNGLSNVAKNNSTDIFSDNAKNKNQQAASLAPLRRHGAGKLSVSLGKDQNGSLMIKSVTSKNESKRPALNIKESDTFGAPPRLTRSLTPVHLEVPKRPPLQKLDERPAKNNNFVQSNEVIVEIERPPTRNRYGKSELQELRQQLTSDRTSNNETETLCLPSMAVKTPLESEKLRRRKARFNKEINRKSKYGYNNNNRSDRNNEGMSGDRRSLKRSEGRRSFKRSPETVRQSSALKLNHRLKRYSPGNTIRKLPGIERAELPKTEQENASTVSRLPTKCRVTLDDCSGIKERPPSVPPRTWIMEPNIERVSSPSFQKRDDRLNQSLNVYNKSSLLAKKEEILSKRISMSLDRTRCSSNRNSDEALLPLAVDVDHSSTTLSSSYEDTWPPKMPPTVQTSYGIPCQPATRTTKEIDNVDGDDNNNNNRHKNSKDNNNSNDILINEVKRKLKKYRPTLCPDNLSHHTDPPYINMSRSPNARTPRVKSPAESTNTPKTSCVNVPESDNVYASKSYSSRCEDGYLEPFLRSSCLEADLIARAKLELILKYAEQQRQLKKLQKQQRSETLENLSSTLDVEDLLGMTSNFTDISTETNKMDKRISPNYFEWQKSLGLTENPYSNGEFFGAVGVLLFIIIILIVVIILGYCWWRKQRDNDDGDSEANLATKPSAIAEYDNLSKNSSKMNGIENNAANLSGLLESGDLPKEDYDSESQVPPLKSDVVEKIENENLYTSLGPRIPDNAAGDSLPAEEPPIRTIVYDNLESVPTLEDMEGIPDNTEVASPDPLESVPTQEDTDAIYNNSDVASQQSLEVPVTMTFADLGKNNSVSFADDDNLLEPDTDGQDDNQTDGLSYVDHIDNDGNNDDDDNHSDSSDKPNDEEMTWVVADNDGSQLGQEDTDQTTDEESPQQSPLPQNNEIAYAPLLDDSQRDSWGTTNPVYDSIRL
ncbi:mucin-5AC-like isoform X2 [Octopus vulgaris]|uniref:Mucin-5AC-like isoform X2 n=1 Tax=Octopus vulgaris TaxID=6645 RepID=A0AA36BTK3_OCTVU|nr:mucin-5AC-like isoform X2 [Octopus vulgaris]